MELSMKILMIMRGHLPGKKYGGPPISVDNFCSLIASEECYIVTSNHDLGETKPYNDVPTGEWVDRHNSRVLYLSDKDYNKASFEKVIKEICPDLIYLQGLFPSCVLPTLLLAKKYGISVLLAPRGELCRGAFKKKYKKIPYIILLKMLGLIKNAHFQSTSDEETEAIHKYLGAPYERIHFLTNVPSIPSTKPIKPTKVAGEAKFVFLSRIHPKKNLISAIRYLDNIKGKVSFDVYGPLEDEAYWEECLELAKQLPDNISVNYCGLVSHEDVHATFSKYDAFIFPTFSENFGHVISEALFAGCTAIISDQTPWTDMNEYGAGTALPLSDKDGMKSAIQRVVDMDNDEISTLRSRIEAYLDKKIAISELREAYLSVLKKI